jgi:hypothetical protein
MGSQTYCTSFDSVGSPASNVHDEVSVCGKATHLTFGITTIGAVCVSLDRLSDSQLPRCVQGAAEGDTSTVKIVIGPAPFVNPLTVNAGTAAKKAGRVKGEINKAS